MLLKPFLFEEKPLSQMFLTQNTDLAKNNLGSGIASESHKILLKKKTINCVGKTELRRAKLSKM